MWFTVNSADIKKIRNTLDNLYLEKQKMEKGDKAKKNKGKGKAKLKMEGENVSMCKKKLMEKLQFFFNCSNCPLTSPITQMITMHSTILCSSNNNLFIFLLIIEFKQNSAFISFKYF